MRLPISIVSLVMLFAPANADAQSFGTLDRVASQLTDKIAAAIVSRAAPHSRLRIVLDPDRQSGAVAATLERLLLAKMTQRVPRAKLRTRVLLSTAKQSSAPDEFSLRLALSVKGGHLELRGEVRQRHQTLWHAAAQPKVGSLALIFLRERVDAEIRSFLQGPKAVPFKFRPQQLALPCSAIVDVAVLDADNDGIADLAVLEPGRLRLVRYDARKGLFADWLEASLGPAAGVASRRAFGKLAVKRLAQGAVEIWARSSGEAKGSVFTVRDGKLQAVRQFDDYVVGFVATASGQEPIIATAKRGRDYFLGLKGPGITSALARRAKRGFYDYRQVVTTAKGKQTIHSVLVDLEGRASTFRDGRVASSPVRVGSSVTLADLADKGAPQLVASGAGNLGEPDHLTIYRAARRRRIRARWRSRPLNSGIEAVIHGDIDNDGTLEIVAALAPKGGQCTVIVVD